MDDWERCQHCDKLYGETWRAPDVLWQKITGITDGSGLFCIECFSIIAERKGIFLYWECDCRPMDWNFGMEGFKPINHRVI